MNTPPTPILPQYPPPSNQSNQAQSKRTPGNGLPTPLSEMRSTPSSMSSNLPNHHNGDHGPISTITPGRYHLPQPQSPNHQGGHVSSMRDNGQREDVKPLDQGQGSGSNKKRPRRPSNGDQEGNSPPGNTGRMQGGKGRMSTPGGEAPPAVLVREKKQKACSNCRRAKLKCIVDDGETDCIRCKARKEKCVFYPRSHDEDWQQTLTADVYTALDHLSNLSSAVHHILHHLTAQRIIPTYPGMVFQPYQRPERDLSILQGWGGEKTRDSTDEAKKRRRGMTLESKVEDDDQDLRHVGPSGEVMPPYPMNGRGSMVAQPSTPLLDRSPWTPQVGSIGSIGSDPRTSPVVSMGPSMPPFPGHPPAPPHISHRDSAPELPPIRAPGPGPIHLTPTSELDLPLGMGSSSFSSGSRSFALPPPSNHRYDQPFMQPPPPMNKVERSPTVAQNVTPNSVLNSSPSTNGGWNMQPAPQDGHPIQGGMGQQGPGHPFMDNDGANPVMGGSFDHQPMRGGPPDEIYGSADGRETVITKNIIPASAAKTLVTFFHEQLSPFLFGYHLQLRVFPYLPEGPSHITPFILAVECLLSSERFPSLYTYHGPLADSVLNMLLTSPAESWQTIQGSREIREARAKEQVLGKAFDGDTNEWDAELGIGPEEIVAACALAAFIGQKEHAKHIAQYAFMWARGWTAYLKEPGATFAEATGLVTPLRRPSEPDMARVWLLCYVVSGQEILQSSDNEMGPPHDPMRWCRVLLPDTRGGNDAPPSPYDILLVFHARLLQLLLDWQRLRSEVHRQDSISSQSSHYNQVVSQEHKRMASKTNAALDWWNDDLNSYRLDPVWTKQIMIDFLNGKVLVNSVASKNIWGGMDDDRLREGTRAMGVDAAFQLLRKCVEWSPPEAVTNLPQTYLWMIALAAGEIADTMAEVEHGNFSRLSCPVSVNEVVPVLSSLANMLDLGGLPRGHGCRKAGHVLNQHVENIKRLTMT